MLIKLFGFGAGKIRKEFGGAIIIDDPHKASEASSDTDVSIDFVEVVPYSSELSSNIVIDTPIDVAPLPPQACNYEAFELPYYLAVMALGERQIDDELAYESNYGLVGVVAEKPQNNSLYAVMMTNSGTDGKEWLRAVTIDSVPKSWQSGTKLYFCGNDVIYDQIEYIAGEEILAAALTATPSGL